jgi:hypothetical protein
VSNDGKLWRAAWLLGLIGLGIAWGLIVFGLMYAVLVL